jgi:hypothetical protein
LEFKTLDEPGCEFDLLAHDVENVVGMAHQSFPMEVAKLRRRRRASSEYSSA